MTHTTDAVSPAQNARDRIIVALDVETAGHANEVIRELDGQVGAFKVGLQLFTAAGPAFVQELTAAGVKVFLDLKFHDIPNTVAKASVEAARLGVWMFDLHVAGGSQMMRSAVDELDKACKEENLRRPLIIGVTVLTSSAADTLAEVGIDSPVEDQVTRLARLADQCGLDGVVASAREVSNVKTVVRRKEFLAVTPGIRGNHATVGDQQRVTTFREALANGSDYVVIGRPILQTADRSAAVDEIVAEVE
ncbi:MAG: orotidine-5'-phosphate decarboxylase [Pyrinomonadaceae bacterium]